MLYFIHIYICRITPYCYAVIKLCGRVTILYITLNNVLAILVFIRHKTDIVCDNVLQKFQSNLSLRKYYLKERPR